MLSFKAQTVTPVRSMVHTTRYRLRKTCPPHTKIASVRQSRGFMAVAGEARDKNGQEKDSIVVERTEYTKSGSDDQVLRETDEAFDPKKTDPSALKEEMETTRRGRNVSFIAPVSSFLGGRTNNKTGPRRQKPLDVSPANPQVSKQRNPTEAGAGASGEDAAVARIVAAEEQEGAAGVKGRRKRGRASSRLPTAGEVARSRSSAGPGEGGVSWP
ncbi:hypothetical protein GP486_004719 [Trichoglossum hirsutum]|uniref:Uncharacterized protein n=1 Tax=Trichoglossum hirsutum TaxID=265104 RepID=A0A9P8RP68_9PEZI|nr:hypothetical protein GP486_004719 [Trichoglossum hirsutum]